MTTTEEKEKVELKKIEKTEWRFKYRGVECKVVFWSTDSMKKDLTIYTQGGIWNSYFLLRKEHLGYKFARFEVPVKSYERTKGRTGYYYGFSKIGEMIGMYNGISYYNLLRNAVGEIIAVEIGDDYSHSWDVGMFYDEEIISENLMKSVDNVLNWLDIEKLENDYGVY